jgi:hypothetical protein
VIEPRDPIGVVTKVSEAAAMASGRCPRPLRSVVDRTLVDVACLASGGVNRVAEELWVDVPAVGAWRDAGVPDEFRAQLHAMAVWRPLRPRRPPVRRQPVAA